MKRLTLSSLYALLACTLLGGPSPAFAGEVEHAEHVQLYEEMRRLAARNAWNGVEDNYLQLLELEKKGEPMTFEDHRLGAEAARALGNMTACYKRLGRAAELKSTDEVQAFIREIEQNFGTVTITIHPRYDGPRQLVAVVPPFAPEQRANIVFVNGRIANVDTYEGLLPIGEYTVGDQKFTVVARQSVPIVLGPPQEEPFDTQAGLRLSVGPSFTSAGSPAAGSAEGTLSPGGFSGAGVRVGVGTEVAFSKSLHAVVQVGYHNLLSGVGTSAGTEQAENISGYTLLPSQLHLGYGWLGLGWRSGDVRIAVGPAYAVGPAQATDLGDYNTTLPNTQPYTYTGMMKAGGGALGLSYSLASAGKMDIALGVDGGALSDGDRWLPWGDVAFAMVPHFNN